MKDFIEIENINPNQKNEEKKPRKINKKKIAVLIAIAVLIVVIIMMTVLYASVTPFRKFCDRYIFRKMVSEEKLASVQLDYDSNVNVIGYNKHICVLAENKLRQYNAAGNLANEMKLEINNPVYHTNNRHLAISEKGSSKIYSIIDNKIAWEKDIGGRKC